MRKSMPTKKLLLCTAAALLSLGLTGGAPPHAFAAETSLADEQDSAQSPDDSVTSEGGTADSTAVKGREHKSSIQDSVAPSAADNPDASPAARAGAEAARQEHETSPSGNAGSDSADDAAAAAPTGAALVGKTTASPAQGAAPNAANANIATSSPDATQPQAVAAGTVNAPAAAEGETELVHQTWPFDGIFGTYDRAALQRGFQVYKQVCSACHSMNLLSYRNLQDIGFTEGQVKAIAADYQIHDGPNDEGEMFDRPGRPSDRFKAPFANKKASMAANGGAYPPDMSLLVKAREGGADYVYGILTGFAKPPEGTTLQPGQYWNKAMKGHIIAMPPPLSDGQVQYEGAEGIPLTTDQYARDVSQFLAWASEPQMEARKRTGTKAMFFLLVFTFVMYSAKKKIWRNVH